MNHHPITLGTSRLRTETAGVVSCSILKFSKYIMIIDDNMRWMTKAIDQANCALKKDEVPIGAVIVKDNKIIGKGFNQVESLKDSTCSWALKF